MMESSKSFLTPYQRGFYCDDQSISYPIKDETIPMIVFLPLFGCCLPLLTVIFECLKLQAWRNAINSRQNFPCKPILAGLVIVVIFLLMFIVDFVIKISVGELRPNFLAICKPIWDEINCTDSNGNPQYIFPIPCSNETENYILQKARTSFFSGHASLSAFSVTVIILYLHDIVPKTSKCTTSVRLVLQLLLAMLSFYMGLSRIWDHMHHWWDVAIGFLFGIVVGYVVKNQVLGAFFSTNNSYNVNENGTVLVIDSETKQMTSDSIIETDTLLSGNGVEVNTTKI